jgi:hypothetical protein
MLLYDVKIYNKDGREGPTVRGLRLTQMLALTQGLDHHDIQYNTISYEERV